MQIKNFGPLALSRLAEKKRIREIKFKNLQTPFDTPFNKAYREKYNSNFSK